MLSTIHRFTPPTCTLEIKGKKSPLSRWQNRDILQKMQFKLSFDDPRIPSHQQVTVRGDRAELERLKTAVDNYVQNYLHGSFTESRGNREDQNTDDRDRPYLRGTGLVSQELILGNLKCDRDIDKIDLSTTQLFDLVTALEAYDTKIAALPASNQNRPRSLFLIAGVGAAGLIAAVGMTQILMQNSSVPDIASSEPESSTPIPQLDEVIPPSAPTKERKTPQPRSNNSLSSTEKLPPPPAVDTPKPKPDILDPADYPLSKVARQSGFKDLRKQTSREQTESIINIPAEVTQKPTESSASNRNSLSQNDAEFSQQPLESSNEIVTASPNTQAKTATNSQQPSSAGDRVRAYFLEKWQPPTDLKQSLEYRLHLNPDGSIARVTPIGKAAKLYLSQTNIPLGGEAFIEPLPQAQSSKIRLLLNPDGGVKVFVEQ